MDRSIVYSSSLPQDADILAPQVAAMTALGFLMRAAFGTSTLADGLACAPTLVPSMSVTVAPGSVMTLLTIDGSSFGSLPARSTEPLVKMGINTLPTTLGPFTAPVTAGQSQCFLIQAQVSETDANPVVLPYYNAANPAVPYSGPANAGTAQNTQRKQTVLLQVKAGAPATTGSQVAPTPDAGFVGLHLLTISNGAAVLLAGNIETFRTAPFIPAKLGVGSLFGFGRMQVFTAADTFIVPVGVTTIKVRLWAGGGAGGNCNAAVPSAGGGGGGGGYAEGVYTVTPGGGISVTVGAPGLMGTPPTSGGSSSVGSLISATAGAVGAVGPPSGYGVGGLGGHGVGGQFNGFAQGGGFGQIIGGGALGGAGGATYGGPAGYGTVAVGGIGMTPGGGGAGGAGTQPGQTGGAGLVIIEW